MGVGVDHCVYGRVFVAFRFQKPQKGDLIMVRAPRTSALRGKTLVKFVEGVAGDCVRVDESTVSIGNFCAVARKKYSVCEAGLIPEGKMFVCGTHPASFDSRYKNVGLMNECDCVGVVRVVLV